MADPNQTPQRGDWICPCNGCKKARQKAFSEIANILDQGGDAYTKIANIKKLVEQK